MYVTDNQDTKVKLSTIRKKLGMSQRELAIALESNRTAISALENGRYIPDWLSKAITLSHILRKGGYSLEDLLLSYPDPETSSIPRAAEKPAKYK